MKYPQKAHWKGKNHSVESIERMKGRIPWNKGMKMSEEYCKKLSELHKGELHWNWKGGISPERKRVWASREYKKWRENVFIRDNYTCQWCKKRGIELNADHIKPFSRFPELRFELSNGRTLCVACHAKTDTYRGKLNKGSKYNKHAANPSTDQNPGGPA